MALNPNPNGFEPEGKNHTQLDTYVNGKLTEYREGNDTILWAMFIQDFSKWTLDNLKKLIMLLKSHSVYVDEMNEHLVA
ncbi:hypothetical protein TSTA_080750 [Talaromyces stipitatus ATCC 10500]|uniref:Uncharacterized protein n=1 Tax=Talaromyces stipitatus (strain ATCC 10500 / CBS 375.48 / QM 6759 / NRRL 1006) TaxID=441959 RepID=B8LZR0_TALSN|nr:uncharacterized protein TSTA_080750 [Talaromyces stipitatus ATCC 10500]EED20842.1 hypothetical protein TSTA_080750 [Talaromyces stipitatus ATCC 10500]